MRQAPSRAASPDGRDRIERMRASDAFHRTGVVQETDAGAAWVLVDPGRHRLEVWRREGRGLASYAASATRLDAAVFTNGPMMGKRLPSGRKLSRTSAAADAAVSVLVLAASGAAVGHVTGQRRPFAAAGAAVGAVRAWRRCFAGWSSCGAAASAANALRERATFDEEGRRHAWLGRFGPGFASYAVGHGDLPHDVTEGVGGLILLVRDFAVVSPGASEDEPGFDLAQLGRKRGVVAWALIPLEQPGEGLLAILGSRQLDAATAAHALAAAGARDAVAADQSSCAMMGARTAFLVGPPPLHRQAMQTYGMGCR